MIVIPFLPGSPISYLWVQNGQRVTPEAFSRRFELTMGEYCDCKIKPSLYRQMAVGIGREHILPQHFVEDSTIDEAAHHGGPVAYSHYGIVERDLPHLTADTIWRHRDVDKEWHNIVGVGKHQPPQPLRLLATKDDDHRPLLLNDHSPGTTGSLTDTSQH